MHNNKKVINNVKLPNSKIKKQNNKNKQNKQKIKKTKKLWQLLKQMIKKKLKKRMFNHKNLKNLKNQIIKNIWTLKKKQDQVLTILKKLIKYFNIKQNKKIKKRKKIFFFYKIPKCKSHQIT